MLGSHVRVMGRCPLWHEVFFWTRVHIQQGVRSMKHLLVIAAVLALFCIGLDGGVAIAQEPPPDGGTGGALPFDQQRYEALRVQLANEILRQAFVEGVAIECQNYTIWLKGQLATSTLAQETIDVLSALLDLNLIDIAKGVHAADMMELYLIYAGAKLDMANSTQQNDPYLDEADALLANASMAGTECETIIMRAYRDAEIVERALGLRQ